MLHILHCPLSGPDLIYISLLIIFCIIEYVTNKKTLNLLQDTEGPAFTTMAITSKYSNNNLLNLYSTFLGTQSALHSKGEGGGVSPPG